MSLKNLDKEGAWGNLIWEESEGPKLRKMMSEQKELKARIESLEERLYGAMRHIGVPPVMQYGLPAPAVPT